MTTNAPTAAATPVPAKKRLTKTEHAHRQAERIRSLDQQAPHPCQRCSTLKTGGCCFWDPTNPTGACSRCTKMKERCSFTGPTKRRNTAALPLPTTTSAWTPINKIKTSPSDDGSGNNGGGGNSGGGKNGSGRNSGNASDVEGVEDPKNGERSWKSGRISIDSLLN
ncbi:hypothetical protein ACRALDRAFT_1067287 [Sodiomyces alcalophilus JCM 7366]|uniref:uncharacterized protein n=1 Tax=Sodiomyces alcalophilus JCM 7366 TaxID=591952 RepID=UPI0039B55FB8